MYRMRNEEIEMKYVITTFDKNGKAIAETTRLTKEGLEACLNWMVRGESVDTFTIEEYN